MQFTSRKCNSNFRLLAKYLNKFYKINKIYLIKNLKKALIQNPLSKIVVISFGLVKYNDILP